MQFRLVWIFVCGVLVLSCEGGTNPDAGVVDGGIAADAGALDAGAFDGGTPVDGGVFDAGPAPDGGADDAGTNEPDPSEPDVPPSSLGVAYWQSIDRTLTDAALVNALEARLSSTHTRIGFDSLWDEYAAVDQGRGCGSNIFDMYSDRCWAPEDKCGQYSQEGDCFNREHLWPKSWWGGREGTDAHSDLFVVVPTDGYVNGRRANLTFGEVRRADYTSSNQSVLGPCQSAAVSALDCFLPAAHVRGDIARIYFYFAVRYENEFTCCDEPGTNNADIDRWQEEMLRQWHLDDPVDDDERERNERVFVVQRNRNPFVDYPNLVFAISDF